MITGTRDSDVDLCMESRWQGGAATVAAERALKVAGYATANAIRSAKVPIVKLTDPQTGLQCDICFKFSHMRNIEPMRQTF